MFLIRRLKNMALLLGEAWKFGPKTALYHVLSTKSSGAKREKYKTLYCMGLDRVYRKMPGREFAQYLRKRYKSVMKKDLSYSNPRTFTEKIQWIKMHDSGMKKTILADKYAVREWISKKIGEEYLVPVLGVWDSFEQIDFDSLPDAFCLKTNHGSAMSYVVKDKNNMDIREAEEFLKWWIKRPFWVFSLEPHYRKINRKIIAEKYIEDSDGSLYDYKIHCFGGEPVFVQCIGDRELMEHKGFQANFDLDWNKLDWSFETYPSFPHDVPKPECLDEMLSVARKLSKDFSYVRVDLYEIEGKVYFGEMTFTPASGFYPYKGTWTPEKDRQLGRLIDLSQNCNSCR